MPRGFAAGDAQSPAFASPQTGLETDLPAGSPRRDTRFRYRLRMSITGSSSGNASKMSRACTRSRQAIGDPPGQRHQAFRRHEHFVPRAYSEFCDAGIRMPVDSGKCRTEWSDRRIVPLPPKMHGISYTKALDGLRKRRAIGL